MKSYGWMNKRVIRAYHDWMGKGQGSGGGGLTGYQYGWPAGGTSESNVVLQYIFDEASGNIFDEVNSLEATPDSTSASDITYNVDATGGDWANLSPGILLENGNEIVNTDVNPNGIQPGTGDYTVEWVAEIDSSAGTGLAYFFSTGDVTNFQGINLYMTFVNGVSSTFTWLIRASDNTLLNPIYTHNTDLRGDGYHKYRAVFDRSGNFEQFLDGVSQGTTSMATLSGKTIPHNQLRISGQFNTLNTNLPATWLELRFSQNDSNNSGGPGGG